MSYGEFVNILQTISHVIDDNRAFEFLFSMRPIMILLIAMGVWLTAFIFVLIYLMDESKQSKISSDKKYFVVSIHISPWLQNNKFVIITSSLSD